MLVVKVGGGEKINRDAVCDDIATLAKEGQFLVLVHGGASEMNEVAEQLGHPPQFVTSPSGHVSRRTDRRTLEIFEMVYCGKVNKGLVERLQSRGVNAVGLSGLDGRLLEGERKAAAKIIEDGRIRVLRDDYSGKVDRVNTGFLGLLLQAGYLPVLTPPAISTQHEAINIDADRAAAAVAGALGAGTLILLSNVPGLLRSFPDEDSLIPILKRSQLDEAMALAQGRMKKKVLAAFEALDAGVAQVILGDARRENPIRAALAGTGTVIR